VLHTNRDGWVKWREKRGGTSACIVYLCRLCTMPRTVSVSPRSMAKQGRVAAPAAAVKGGRVHRDAYTSKQARNERMMHTTRSCLHVVKDISPTLPGHQPHDTHGHPPSHPVCCIYTPFYLIAYDEPSVFFRGQFVSRNDSL
jgi:hypothetical protein